jgi:hypothetical protein
MLTHAFRTIKAGWGFQLKQDVTGKLCWKSVDLLAFSVTSIPKCNYTLCLCIIPSTTESEQAYTVVYNELRKAVCLVPSIKSCDDEDCSNYLISTRSASTIRSNYLIRAPKKSVRS